MAPQPEVTIPDVLASGWLPDGVHEATLEELRERFGRFRTSDKRVRMCARLCEYLAELKAWKITDVAYVDGSFVSAKGDPDDVDVTFALSDEFLVRADEWTPSEYNLVQNAFTRQRYGVDAWPEPGDHPLQRRVSSWRRMKPPLKGAKGVLRVKL